MASVERNTLGLAAICGRFPQGIGHGSSFSSQASVQSAQLSDTYGFSVLKQNFDLMQSLHAWRTVSRAQNLPVLQAWRLNRRICIGSTCCEKAPGLGAAGLPIQALKVFAQRGLPLTGRVPPKEKFRVPAIWGPVNPVAFEYKVVARPFQRIELVPVFSAASCLLQRDRHAPQVGRQLLHGLLKEC